MLATRGIFSPFYYGCATGHDITGFFQGFGATSLLFISNILEIANTGGNVLEEWGTAIARTKEKLDEIANNLKKFGATGETQGIVAGFVDGAGIKISLKLSIPEVNRIDEFFTGESPPSLEDIDLIPPKELPLEGGGFIKGYEEGLKYLKALTPK
jgi:hypothetical protein